MLQLYVAYSSIVRRVFLLYSKWLWTQYSTTHIVLGTCLRVELSYALAMLCFVLCTLPTWSTPTNVCCVSCLWCAKELYKLCPSSPTITYRLSCSNLTSIQSLYYVRQRFSCALHTQTSNLCGTNSKDDALIIPNEIKSGHDPFMLSMGLQINAWRCLMQFLVLISSSFS